MKLWDAIEAYQPQCLQEERDKEQMLQFMRIHDNYLDRENLFGHFTASMWTVNKERTKVLMAHHNRYHSWAWIGGHADGEEDLCAVALRELQEETGVQHARLVSEEIFSLESLTCSGYMSRGVWVPGHLHLNLTFLAEADEHEAVKPQEEENSAVQWWSFEEALKVSSEPWMVEHIYKKLIAKMK